LSSSPAIEHSSLTETSAALWKQEISERVRAHRTRQQPAQGLSGQDTSETDWPNRRTNPRTAGVAASVAERYAAALSYSEYLARVNHVQEEAASQSGPAMAPEPAFHDAQIHFANEGSCALDPYAETAAPEMHLEPARDFASEVSEVVTATPQEPLLDQAAFLEQVTVEPDVPITTKLIEFPRQIVAPRKARPRLAEGPLRDADIAAPGASPQLRIFEVDEAPTQAVAQPAPPAASVAAPQAPPAEWHYIQLDTPLLSTVTAAEPLAQARTLQDIAPIERRLMAAVVDLCLVSLGFLAFTVAFVAMATTPPTDSFALISAAIVFAVLFGTYQWTFLTLSDATPGMRYARIALCTFEDENPLRRMRRRRLAATLLSAGAAGLGFAWALLDHERLSWHDRLSHTYQRCY
jgi:uncharacterized RDD family membrane protein YckC